MTQGETAATNATTQADGALAAAETSVRSIETKVDGAMEKAGDADGTRALPGLGDAAAAAADPYAQDPEDKKKVECNLPKMKDSCVIA